MRRFSFLVLVVSAFVLGGCFKSTIVLRNQTTVDLVPYPVVTSPPPPHRAADASATLAHGDTTSIDPDGFNPLFYTPNVADPSIANAVYIGLDLYDDEPYAILYRVLHYPVPPGQEGNDPALQPTVLSEEIVEVDDEPIEIRVIGVPGASLDPPGGWRVTILPQ